MSPGVCIPCSVYCLLKLGSSLQPLTIVEIICTCQKQEILISEEQPETVKILHFEQLVTLFGTFLSRLSWVAKLKNARFTSNPLYSHFSSYFRPQMAEINLRYLRHLLVMKKCRYDFKAI
jgi:hypothetical protein